MFNNKIKVDFNTFKLFSLYFHTLKYLKISQVYFRFVNILEIKKVEKTIPNLNVIKFNGWINIISKKKEINKRNYFTFLNKKKFVNTNNWRINECNKLWVYNLHYFNFLNTKEYKKIYYDEDLIEKWIVANKNVGGIGWERYPTSIRVVNWIKWFLSGNKISNECFNSLYIQARWIYKNPERHLLGNHFFSNLKALIFSGCLFDTKEAEKWLKWSKKNLHKQLKEQILIDGAHFERSPMYHALFLEDLLDLVNLANINKKIEEKTRLILISVIKKMMIWLKNMTHPDGEISFFNDASLGIAKNYSDLEYYANKLNINISLKDENYKKLILKKYLDSGYIRLETKKAVAILDVASLGPDYLPAHGHADTLSFELSIFNQRIIVNGGTSYYGDSNKRLIERKTLSHSTVEIDNTDSSQVWSNFRVAKRAYPKMLSIDEQNNEVNVSCSHSGYINQGLNVWPIRNWKLKNNIFEISDLIKGNYNSAISRFIFHPSVKVLKKNQTTFEIDIKSKKNIQIRLFDCEGKIGEARYGEEFGKSIKTKCLIIKITKLSRCQFVW